MVPIIMYIICLIIYTKRAALQTTEFKSKIVILAIYYTNRNRFDYSSPTRSEKSILSVSEGTALYYKIK